MARFDLTVFAWSVSEPLLPTKVRGVKRRDERRVLDGIFWRLRTGAPWADIPARHGSHTTCVNVSTDGAGLVIGREYPQPYQKLMTAISK